MRILAKGMITNVQILTDEGNIIAVVDAPEKRISAAYQNMRAIPNVLTEHYGKWVEILDLSHNKLRDVSPLKAIPNLHTLILDHNLILSTTVFPSLPSLRVLWVNFNLISNVSLFVPPLARSCPNLRHLSLMGNMAAPITHKEASEKDEDSYRQYVISHFENIGHLDDKPVAAFERLQRGTGEMSYAEEFQNCLKDFQSFLMLKIRKNFNNSIV